MERDFGRVCRRRSIRYARRVNGLVSDHLHGTACLYDTRFRGSRNGTHPALTQSQALPRRDSHLRDRRHRGIAARTSWQSRTLGHRRRYSHNGTDTKCALGNGRRGSSRCYMGAGILELAAGRTPKNVSILPLADNGTYCVDENTRNHEGRKPVEIVGRQ